MLRAYSESRHRLRSTVRKSWVPGNIHQQSGAGRGRDRGTIPWSGQIAANRDQRATTTLHAAIANLPQRTDEADGRWRSPDEKQLYAMKLSVAAAEVGGVSQKVMDLFSSRNRTITSSWRPGLDTAKLLKGWPHSQGRGGAQAYTAPVCFAPRAIGGVAVGSGSGR